ncbi:RNA polymerase sigma-70 factor [Flavobacteriaceae bacterium F08102]|nr:RNA polymerase sigma-70 factor [Flavobacteriaceae bacterium F08102]
MQGTKLLEQELLKRFNAGDEAALRYLYDTYWEQLYVSAYNLVKNREVCEDILQDIFIKLWDKRGNIVIKTSLKAYLHTSVLYKVYDYFRKNKGVFHEELIEDFDRKIQYTTPESKLIYEELVAHVNASIELLPPKCRAVFKLSREKQLSHKEIAAELNISVKSVESHITKALKHLRGSLSNIASVELALFIFHDLLP